TLEPAQGLFDRSRCEQIMVNLLTNAMKYAAGKPIRVEVHHPEGKALLRVQDFGPGIPEDRQDRIFERFERATASRNISGLGLGLFIVKQISEAHGGAVGVESESGKGSTFWVELPTQPTVALTAPLS